MLCRSCFPTGSAVRRYATYLKMSRIYVVGPPDGSKPREVLLDEEGLAALEEVEARMSAEDEFGGF